MEGRVTIKLEFSGGLELLLADPKQTKPSLTVASGSTIRDLVKTVRSELIKTRPELYATPAGEV